jgi:predicted 3-demethylubiquinone-9 3-methyltransferase (glyoxalase superfamily)
MPTITTCLWYRSEAEEAAKRYVSIFPNSKIVNVLRGGEAVIAVDFILDGQKFTALNGRQSAGFNDSTSLMVPCETQQEIDRYWNALTDGGEEGQCGWLKDRYDVSWQVFPRELVSLLGDPDPEKAGRVAQAMFPMKKLDLAALHRARDGEVARAR